MTGKISDLSLVDRLRSADVFELQDQTIVGSAQMDSPTLRAGSPLDTTSQILGFTAANIMEVEANTLAARLTLRPDEINYPPAGFTVGRYSWAGSNFGYFSVGASAATPGNIMFEFAWVNVSGIAIIKKVFGNMAVGASTNTVAGSAYMRMFRTFGLGPVLDTSNVQLPPSMGGGPGTATNANTVGGRSPVTGFASLKMNQSPPQARINAGVSRTTRGAGVAENAYTDQFPIGNVEAGFVAGAGRTIFRQAVLFDYMVAEQPLILVPGTGFECSYSIPTTSAGSTTTLMEFINMQWDEWTLSTPDDR